MVAAKPTWHETSENSDENCDDEMCGAAQQNCGLKQKPCVPEYYPDPNIRVLVKGHIAYFLRNFSPSLGYDDPVPELASANSLEILCDPVKFNQQAECCDSNIVKRRKLNSGAAAGQQNADCDREPSGSRSPHRKPSGHQKRSAKDVLVKDNCADTLTSGFGLKAIYGEQIDGVFKRLRGQLRNRVLNSKQYSTAQLQLQAVVQDVAQYLVVYHNHPDSGLQKIVSFVEADPVECLRVIKRWFDEGAKSQLNIDENSMRAIAEVLLSQVQSLASLAKPEWRRHLRKSLHTLPCWKIPVVRNGPLHNCYSGPFNVVQTILNNTEPEVARQLLTDICLDLRNDKGVHVVATFNDNTKVAQLMPGPADPFPEGALYIGCALCQGVAKADCNCVLWMNELGIEPEERQHFEFGLDEMLIPAHLDNYVFGQKRKALDQGILNLRKFITSEDGGRGVQIMALTKEGSQ